MKKHLPEITTYTALILLALMPFISDVFADVNKKENVSAAPPMFNKITSVTKRNVLAEKKQQLVNEAEEAVSGTQKALEALEQNNPKAAVSLLQTVSGKLDIILAKDPSLTLVPAGIETDIFDFNGDTKTIKQEIKKADKLLDAGKIQGARQILTELASEIRVTLTNIPLGSFPVAIKEAVKLIDAGKPTEAANILNEVLSMLVKTTEIIPLPIINAEALLNKASELEYKEDLTTEKSKEEVMKLANEAKDNLKLAKLLGYGSNDDYKTLYNAIDDIEETLHSEKSRTTWEKIKQSLTELKNKMIHFKK
jgi:hypothetical protein